MSIRALLKLICGSVTVALLVACQPPQNAETPGSPPPAMPASKTSQDFGAYTVHFNALATDQLTAEVARSYGIVRSPNRAMLNVSVIRKQEGTIGEAVAAEVSASANNLTGQMKQMTIREIRDQDAIYYIGEVTVANEEILQFSVDVKPEGEPKAFSTINFKKQFYTN